MNRFAVALLIASASLAVAQQPDPKAKARPGICFVQYEGDPASDDLRKLIEHLAKVTFEERAAADVLRVPKRDRFRHEIRFFPHGLSAHGTPSIDLNEVYVHLGWRTPEGKPAKHDEKGEVVLRIGRKTFTKKGEQLTAKPEHTAWSQLTAELKRFRMSYKGSSPYGVPLVLVADRGVPVGVIRRAAHVMAANYGGLKGHPAAPGVPAETQGKWRAPVEAEFEEAIEREVERDGVVEKPIIILEEEVEVMEDVPKGTDFSNLSNKNLDSTSANDAYGVGGGAAGPYGQRFGKGPLAREGGSQTTEDAVRAGLRWLKRKQAANGSFGEGDQVLHTARALLAFVGAGHTHRAGPFKRTVNKAMGWLKQQQKADGSIGGSPVGHLAATQALTELLALSRDFRLRRNAEKAWEHALTLDVTQDAMLGLRLVIASGSTKVAELGMQQQKKVQEKVNTALKAGEPSDWEQAVGLVLRAVRQKEGRQSDGYKAGQTFLGKLKPSNSHAWLWGSLATFQIGGSPWKTWNKTLLEHTFPKQVSGGDEDGSWPAEGERSALEVTLDYTLALETYYRFKRADR